MEEKEVRRVGMLCGKGVGVGQRRNEGGRARGREVGVG